MYEGTPCIVYDILSISVGSVCVHLSVWANVGNAIPRNDRLAVIPFCWPSLWLQAVALALSMRPDRSADAFYYCSDADG